MTAAPAPGKWPGEAYGTDVWHLRGSGRQGPLAPAVVVRRSCETKSYTTTTYDHAGASSVSGSNVVRIGYARSAGHLSWRRTSAADTFLSVSCLRNPGQRRITRIR